MSSRKRKATGGSRATTARTAKKYLTTSEAADLMHISQQTVQRLVDTGEMQGAKVPGSKHRRIAPPEAIRIMKKSNWSAEAVEEAVGSMMEYGWTRAELERTALKLLLVVRDSCQAETIVKALSPDARFEITTVYNAFAAGIEAHKLMPALLVLYTGVPGAAELIVGRELRSREELAQTALLLLTKNALPTKRLSTLEDAQVSILTMSRFNSVTFCERVHQLLALSF